MRDLYGTPYVFGGKYVAVSGGLDCSGLVVEAFKRIGVNLGNPNWTSAQKLWADALPIEGPVRRGDLIFFTGTYHAGEQVTHVGIVKEPQPVAIMVDANRPHGVGETHYGSEYWQSHFYDVRRPRALAEGPLPDRPRILNVNGEDIGPMLVQAAHDAGCPWDLALAAAIAESGLDPRAERWGAAATTAAARDAIAHQDWPALQTAIKRAWPDISFGYGQQIVLYHYLGNRTATVENCLAVREGVFADPAANLRDMCQRLAANLARTRDADLSRVDGNRKLAALVIYNAGSLRPPDDPWWETWAGNVASYRRALARAAEMLA